MGGQGIPLLSEGRNLTQVATHQGAVMELLQLAILPLGAFRLT
jgi:hypothetical protein